MISEKQFELADYIKGVHLSLRRRSQQIGAEKAWDEHLKNEQVLKNYSDCMKNLAENFWARNNDSKNSCRIKWMVDFVLEYFENDGIEKEFVKEKSKMEAFSQKMHSNQEEYFQYENFLSPICKKPYKLLDVGSCYNPFKNFDFFDTFAVDLCPASVDVKKCNFLEITVDKWKPDWFSNLKSFPLNFFDIVVFSLFLEYLPLPQQRFSSCKKAYDCLKCNGLLFIATPDSKHQSANSRLLKNWKVALSAIGFVRVKLEKLRYVYCMAFRKALHKDYPGFLYRVKVADIKPDEMIVIPQDFITYKIDDENSTVKITEDDKKETFQYLPHSF